MQTVENGENAGVSRGKINQNFTELGSSVSDLSSQIADVNTNINLLNARVATLENQPKCLFEQWTANTNYAVGTGVINNNSLYACKVSHTSGSSFSASNWFNFSIN